MTGPDGTGAAGSAPADGAAGTPAGHAHRRRFRITSGTTGSVVADVEALSPQGALDALFNGLGDDTAERVQSRTGDDPNDLIVSEILTPDQLGAVATRMDGELRAQVEREHGPAGQPSPDPAAFLARYCALHRARHGADFSWDQEADREAGRDAGRDAG